MKWWQDKGSYSRLSAWMLHFWGVKAQMARKVQPRKKWESRVSRKKWKTRKMLKVKKLSRNRLTCLRKIKQVAVVSSGEKPPQGRGKYDLVWSGLQLQVVVSRRHASAKNFLRLSKNFLTLSDNHSLIHLFIYSLSSTYSMIGTVFKAMGNVKVNKTWACLSPENTAEWVKQTGKLKFQTEWNADFTKYQ